MTICAHCGAQVQPGQRFTQYNLFDLPKHVVCPRTKFDVDPADVCPDCFTVRATNGTCACP